MGNFRFTLDPKTSKDVCPNCGKKEYVRYIDTHLYGQYLPYEYGRCERKYNCGYYNNPYKAGYHLDAPENYGYVPAPLPPPKEPSLIDNDLMKATLKEYERNNFIAFLFSMFDYHKVKEAREKYKIGTSRHWAGSTIFWQIRQNGDVRAGKVILYDLYTGKRVKDGFSRISWVHKILKLEEFELRQCLFGEHLIDEMPESEIGIVESEKTAVIASIHYPDVLWLASGGLKNLTSEKFIPLRHRNVTLFPDSGSYIDWKNKADAIQRSFDEIQISVSADLELYCKEHSLPNNYDLADHILSCL